MVSRRLFNVFQKKLRAPEPQVFHVASLGNLQSILREGFREPRRVWVLSHKLEQSDLNTSLPAFPKRFKANFDGFKTTSDVVNKIIGGALENDATKIAFLFKPRVYKKTRRAGELYGERMPWARVLGLPVTKKDVRAVVVHPKTRETPVKLLTRVFSPPQSNEANSLVTAAMTRELDRLEFDKSRELQGKIDAFKKKYGNSGDYDKSGAVAKECNELLDAAEAEYLNSLGFKNLRKVTIYDYVNAVCRLHKVPVYSFDRLRWREKRLVFPQEPKKQE